jgi:hypothetical protein
MTLKVMRMTQMSLLRGQKEESTKDFHVHNRKQVYVGLSSHMIRRVKGKYLTACYRLIAISILIA